MQMMHIHVEVIVARYNILNGIKVNNTSLYTCSTCTIATIVFNWDSMIKRVLMSIVLNVHPGVQLDTRVDSKKRFCRSVTEGTRLHLTVLAYRTSLFRIGPR